MSLLKELRESTGAPVRDCKDAIESSMAQHEGSFQKESVMESAISKLRVKGLATAAKKSGRAANEGMGAVCSSDNFAVLVEVQSETDFTARNSRFQEGVAEICGAALKFAESQPEGDLDLEALQKAPAGSSDAATVGDIVTTLVTSIRENIQIRRAASVKVNGGVVGIYAHQTPTRSFPNAMLGQQIVVVGLNSKSTATAALKDIGKKLAMQVVAAQPPPSYIIPAEIPRDVLEKETRVHREQIEGVAGWEKKPSPVIEKMMQGLLNKFYEQVCLLKQPYLIGDVEGVKNPKVEDFLREAGSEVGDPDIAVSQFKIFKVGEDSR